MKARTMLGVVGSLVLAGCTGCSDEPPTPGPGGKASSSRTKWKVTGVLNAPHYEIAAAVHARVSGQFSLEVDLKQPYDPDVSDGPVPAEGVFTLVSFAASDQHYHAPISGCIPAAFGGTLAWAPRGGLYQRIAVGFRVDETLPSYQLPISEGACDSLGGETPSRSAARDILVFVPAEVLAGLEPPGGGWVNLGEEGSASESNATSSDTDWVLTWTAP